MYTWIKKELIMALYLLKYPYRKILLPLAKKMVFIDPDLLGYLATIVAFATMFCYLYAQDRPYLLLISILLTLFRMTLNTIDGVIAIERGNLRLKGEIVNALPDRYSDIFILIGIALSPLCTPLLGILGISSMFLVSYTGMLSKAIGANWQHHGPLGKVERLILVMIFSFLEYLSLTGKIHMVCNLTYFMWLMILFIALGQITVYNRLKAQLRECRKLDWIKYRKLDKKAVVLYDSLTGNTEKAAKEAANALSLEALNIKDFINSDLSDYDLVILAAPHLGHKILPQNTIEFLENEHNIKQYALLLTSGMPVYRHISNKKCVNYFIERLGKKPISSINIKGYHAKAKTYKNRPNDNDLLDAYLFAQKVYKTLQQH